MSVYLDASVLVALIGAEDGTQAAIEFVNTATERLLVSDFANGEVSSAVSRLVRTGEIDVAGATERLAAFDEWAAAATRRIPTSDMEIRLAAQLVRQFELGVRMPDAIHLAAAQIHGSTLATLDGRLAMNAEQLRLAYVVPRRGTSDVEHNVKLI